MFKRKRRLASTFALAFLITIVFGILLLFDLTLRRAFYDIAEVRAVQLATEAVHNALQQEVANEGMQYQDFIFIHKDSQGQVALMQTNTVKINKVAASTTLAVQKTLENFRWQSFDIPLGEVLGVPLLAHYGPRVRYHIMPVGSVRVNVLDKFESAGINQTRHSIYLSFSTNVRIVIPSKGGETVIASDVPLAESIIVGSVPRTFITLSGGILGDGSIK